MTAEICLVMKHFINVLGATAALCVAQLANGQITRAFTEPIQSSNVAASEPGIVEAFHVAPGDRVTTGQILAELDKSVIEQTLELAKIKAKSTARIEAAHATLEIRERQFRKLTELDAEGHANQFELERARSELDSARAEHRLAIEEQQQAAIEVKRIAAQLEQRMVRSPFDGIVTRTHCEPGEYVAGNRPELLTVVNLDQLRARFYLHASTANTLRESQSVPIEIQLPGTDSGNVQALQTISAVIEFVSPVVDPKSGTAQVDVLIDNPDHQFQSGLECHIENPNPTNHKSVK